MGAEEAVLVEHPGQDPAQLWPVENRKQQPAFDSRHQRVGHARQEVRVALVVLPGPSRQAGKALDRLARNDRDRAQRNQPDHRTDPQAGGGAIWQTEHVVVEAVLVVPHVVVGLAHLVHGAGDPEEMLDEFQGEVLVAGIDVRRGSGPAPACSG